MPTSRPFHLSGGDLPPIIPASHRQAPMIVQTKLPNVGTTIFTVMSQLALDHGAVNLGQGFPDFAVPEFLVDELDKAVR